MEPRSADDVEREVELFRELRVRALGDVEVFVPLLFAAAKAPDGASPLSVRAEALLQLDDALRRQRPSIGCLFDIALDDGDQQARGAAWHVIAELWRSGEAAQVLDGALEAFRDRYGDVFGAEGQDRDIGYWWLECLALKIGTMRFLLRNGPSQGN